jgi:hypothetical protein
MACGVQAGRETFWLHGCILYDFRCFNRVWVQAGRETFLADTAGAKSVLPRVIKVGYRELQLIYVSARGRLC